MREPAPSEAPCLWHHCSSIRTSQTFSPTSTWEKCAPVGLRPGSHLPSPHPPSHYLSPSSHLDHWRGLLPGHFYNLSGPISVLSAPSNPSDFFHRELVSLLLKAFDDFSCSSAHQLGLWGGPSACHFPRSPCPTRCSPECLTLL